MADRAMNWQRAAASRALSTLALSLATAATAAPQPTDGDAAVPPWLFWFVPSARFVATPEAGLSPLEVSFDASRSSSRNGAIVRYEWTFGDGAAAAGSTAAHTFDQPGTYSVRLTVTDDKGATASASRNIRVNRNPAARIAADPPGGAAPLAVSFDGQSSSDPDGSIERYAWRFEAGAHAEGPTATHTFSEPGLYAVRLIVTDDLGGTDEVVFELNVRDPVREDIDHAVPYMAEGDYAEALAPCLYARAENAEFCTMARLPFLGAEFDDPTVDDVMSRVLVSHRWMGDNLRTLLTMLPADVRLLARSLTGIVIATDIRPAYYSPGSGAIYLDADFFWRTPEQRAVVSREPDYRAAFQRKLQLLLPWRFVRNNQWFAIRRDENGLRAIEDVATYLGFLLYHELSHAGDFVHVSSIAGAEASWTPWEAARRGEAEGWRDWPSSRLQTAYPLRSELMVGLAQISFRGVDPTEEQAALLPEDIVDEFADDGAVDYYSYLTQYEDLAQLHTAALMSYHFGQEQDTGITDNPTEDDAPRIVAWGQRGRMTNATVIDRTRAVLESMYPGDVQRLVGYVSDRPAPLPLRPGDSWRDNVVLAGGGDFSSKATASKASPVLAGSPALQGGTGARDPIARAARGTFLGCIRLDGLPLETLPPRLKSAAAKPPRRALP